MVNYLKDDNQLIVWHVLYELAENELNPSNIGLTDTIRYDNKPIVRNLFRYV